MDVSTIRLSIFITVFCVMLIWEKLLPRHYTVDSKARRIGINLTLSGIDILAVRLLFGAAAVGVAQFAVENSWGLFNQTKWPEGLEVLLAVIALDFSIYLQHVAAHLIPLFWRFHIVHHTDLDLDVSSGLRFHPVEIVGSMLYKIALVCLIGPAPLAVIIFEVILNAMAMFNHSNIKLPGILDRIFRRILVTPDMHRIHHSIERNETNSNYGFNLSLWDRMLGTYLENALKPQSEIIIGIQLYRSPDVVKLKNLLIMPFGNPPPNESPFGRRPLRNSGKKS